jgi:hypothetical protein
MTDSDGKFDLDLLPVGDYVATCSRVIAPPVAFHVAAGTTTPLALALPAMEIALDIELAAADCTGVTVTSMDGRLLAFASCDDPHHAGLDAFAPGTYVLCNHESECTVAEIAAAPAHQHVTIAAPADDPSASAPSDDPSPSPPPEADPAPSPSPTPDPAAPDPGAAADEAASPEG